MVLQGSTGFSGSFGRQTTLNDKTAEMPLTDDLLDALEQSALEGGIILQGEGVSFGEGDETRALALEFSGGVYRMRDGEEMFYRDDLVNMAAEGDVVLTLTGRSGANIDKHMQPALWPVFPIHRQTRNVDLAFLDDQRRLRINARHVQEDASVYVDGRRVDGRVECEHGTLPACEGDVAIVELDSAPPGGLHFMQVQSPAGLFSNDMMFFYDDLESKPSAGARNLISSGGEFHRIQFDRHNWNLVNRDERPDEVASIDWSDRDDQVNIRINRSHTQPWRAQISHAVPVVGGQTYALCFDAKSNEGSRYMTAYTDTNLDLWRNTSGQNTTEDTTSSGQFRADLTTSYQQFKYTFTIQETDLKGRVAFDFAQSANDVQMDNIGLYEGTECGNPAKPT